MAKKRKITIEIDTARSAIHYYSMLGKDAASIEHRVKNYSGPGFDDSFYAQFREIVAELAGESTSRSIKKITLVLPDNAVAVDTVKVPTMRSNSAINNALTLALGEIYRNYADLKISTYQSEQNKQYTTFCISAVQKKILTELYAACSENKMLAETTTYASAATVGAISLLNPGMKNPNYLFLDVKDTYSKFIFVVGGRAAGSYTLPFGLEFLEGGRYVQEDMIFDHTLAEQTVLNARERAKAKNMDNSSVDLDEEAELAEDTSSGFGYGDHVVMSNVTGKKLHSRLPEYMQRPVPVTAEDIINENYRVFVKWALSLLVANESITALGTPEAIIVNLPERLSFAIDHANLEKTENGIEFCRFNAENASEEIISNLELYGGFFPKAIHTSTQF